MNEVIPMQHSLIASFLRNVFFGGLCAVGVMASPLLGVHSDEVDLSWPAYIETQVVDLGVGNDFSPVIEKMKGSRLILLGEATHGTQEYYTVRAELTKLLIDRRLIQFVAVEGDWASLYRVNNYVKGEVDEAESARDILAGLNRWPEWMWANSVVLDLVEWMRAWNLERPAEERVGFYGIDVYGWGDSVEKLPEFLNLLEAEWGDRLRPELRGLRALQGDSQAFVRGVMRGQNFGYAALEAVLEQLREKEVLYRSAAPEAFLQAVQSAQLIAAAKAHLRQSAERNPRSWNPRAENFYATVEQLFGHYGPEARGVLWAHNTHVGDARYTPMQPQGLITVGQQAREALGPEGVFILGFASYSGSFLAGRQWGSPGVVVDLAEPIEGSINRWLGATAPDLALLPLRSAREHAGLREAIGHRAFGVVHQGGGPQNLNFVPSNVPMRYDALLFIRETTALNGLP